VLVGDLPGLLVDVVAHLLDTRPDIVLVGQGEGDTALLDAAHRTRPDVVIVDLPNEQLTPVGEALLRQMPFLAVLGVTRRAGHGFLWVMRPERTALGELAPDSLIEAVRAAACLQGQKPV
jgi:DNA-binding NarL/FixJ family response regulator